jgi:hypothetical protein
MTRSDAYLSRRATIICHRANVSDVDWAANARRAAHLLELRLSEPDLFALSVAAEQDEPCESRLTRVVDLFLGMTDLAAHLAEGLGQYMERDPRELLAEIADGGFQPPGTT